MNKKKGFTLVELLAVIIILSIVVVIAVSAVGGISKRIQQNMYEKKITMLEEAAVQYGQARKNFILNSSSKYETYNCIKIKVSDLVPEYVDNDTGNSCNDVISGTGCIVDPRDESNFLDDKEIIIYARSRRIKAVANFDGKLNCG